MGITSYKGVKPQIGKEVYIAPGAQIIGKVQLGDKVNIWCNTVLRGDVNEIKIGSYTNIQDNSMVHCDRKLPTIVGDYVTVGHQALLHACTIEDYCLIGMGAIILDDAVVGKGSVIGAGSVVTSGTKIPPFSLVVGTPGKVIRTLDEASIEARKEHAERYFNLSKEYME